MKKSMDEIRLRILRNIQSLKGVSCTPEQMQRIRRYISDRPVSEENFVHITAEALRMAGFVASVKMDNGVPKLVVGDTIQAIAIEPLHHSTKVRVWPYLKRILGSEKRDIWYVAVYALLSSLLGLSVPLSSQAIVNAVALGVFNRQLLVLCSVVLVALLILAIISVLERFVVDLIQRRLFVRTAFDIVWRLPLLQRNTEADSYAPELVNRFFDVMTVQKSLGKFLLEGINAILVLTTGLILLAIYHPVFLIYDVLFLLFVPILVFVLGRNAVPTAVQVSKKKYQAAAWLEDVARTYLAFKVIGASGYAFDRMDDIAGKYVTAKHAHFRIVARQIFGSYIFKALATVGILAVGGVLVLEQQMSLGQLVAAEIVIILIIGAIEKLILQFDSYYELMAALEKLSNVIAQPIEENGSIVLPGSGPVRVELDQVKLHFGIPLLHAVSFSVEPAQHVSLVGRSGAGKSTVLHLIAGLLKPEAGTVKVNNIDTRNADLTSLRSRIGMVFPEDQIIEASIRDNILMGRELPEEQLQWAISLMRLENDINSLPHGLATVVSSSGQELSFGMRRRILFARMIVHKPDLLLIDEAFEGIEDSTKLAIVADLFQYRGWTIINVSHDPEVIKRTDFVMVLVNGAIVEQGSPSELASKRSTHFCGLFPEAPDVF